jgi:hypothetical protein
MACPLFESAHVVRCHAVQTEVTPTLHQREQYCLGSNLGSFTRCPTLRLMLRLRRRLDEQEYLSLWIPPRPEIGPRSCR